MAILRKTVSHDQDHVTQEWGLFGLWMDAVPGI